MKGFYGCLDAGFVKYVPQPLQHLALANKASKLGGELLFYTAEDFETLVSQGTIKAKMAEQPAVDGFIFFTIRQFFYGEKLNLNLMNSMLDQKYEIHFAREDLSIPTAESLEMAYPMIYSTCHVLKRDSSDEFWRPIWNSMGQGSSL